MSKHRPLLLTLLGILMCLIVTVSAWSGVRSAAAAPPNKATATPPGPTATPAPATQLQVYGAWHCGSDACTWSAVRDMTDFDQKNHWIIDRGDGQPSVNLVILSFINPLRLMNKTNDAATVDGVPRGM